jgi:RNA methyltransferase, TrmH family
VVEGPKLVAEAHTAGAEIETVFLDADAARPSDRELADACKAGGARILEVQPDILKRALETVTPQPIAATVRRVDVPLVNASSVPPPSPPASSNPPASPTPSSPLADRSSLVIVLAGVSDPGNAGTLIRAASGAGADMLVLCKPSVDLYNPKTVRATAGAIFHLTIAVGYELGETLEMLGTWGMKRWGTAAKGGCDYNEADLTGPTALVLGNEAHGIPNGAALSLDGLLTIPMAGPTESLNVAVAGSVLCFEAARQQRPGRRASDAGELASDMQPSNPTRGARGAA